MLSLEISTLSDLCHTSMACLLWCHLHSSHKITARRRRKLRIASRLNIIVDEEEAGQLQEAGGSQMHSLGGQELEVGGRRGSSAEIFQCFKIMFYLYLVSPFLSSCGKYFVQKTHSLALQPFPMVMLVEISRYSL